MLKKIKKQNKLPSINNVNAQLYARRDQLKEAIYQSIDEEDTLILTIELDKVKVLIAEIEEDYMQTSSDNDTVIENTHAALELAYLTTKRLIDAKIKGHELLEEHLITNYNSAAHKYNLFMNVIDSLCQEVA